MGVDQERQLQTSIYPYLYASVDNFIKLKSLIFLETFSNGVIHSGKKLFVLTGEVWKDIIKKARPPTKSICNLQHRQCLLAQNVTSSKLLVTMVLYIPLHITFTCLWFPEMLLLI